ncbi:MAG: 50S ribosomal protein L30 [Candidatus Cloacimonadota bacterium]|nr:MAG: 50S ribosomal protein L30 [Candidatus Cloacimonadota bacterium]
MKLKITLKRSKIGQKRKRRSTIESLGFKRTYQTIIKDDRPEIRGMIQKVRDMVEVEEISDS